MADNGAVILIKVPRTVSATWHAKPHLSELGRVERGSSGDPVAILTDGKSCPTAARLSRGLVQIGNGRAPSIADGIAEYVNVSHGSFGSSREAVISSRGANGLQGSRHSQEVKSETVDLLAENQEKFVPRRPVETVTGPDVEQRLEAELFSMFRVQDGRVWKDIRAAFVPRYSEKKV